MKFSVKSTSRGGNILVDDNDHSYYKKQNNFYNCVECKKKMANYLVTSRIVDPIAFLHYTPGTNRIR